MQNLRRNMLKSYLLVTILILNLGIGSASQERAYTTSESVSRGDMSVPRGIRLRNPGNIIKTDTTWIGEVKCSDPHFECFSSPEYGIRAMAIILYNYRTVYGLVTVADILYRWMPRSSNPVDSIIDSISDDMCSKYDAISIAGLIAMIVLIENGEMPYSTEELNSSIPDEYKDTIFLCCGCSIAKKLLSDRT